jgi:hypothetical protein
LQVQNEFKMNLQSSNIIKNLNRNYDYTLVLEEIGKSYRPINRYKVMANLDESRYIYSIIDEFCPSEYTIDSYLFDLDSLNENNQDVDFKRKLVQKLNQIYHLNWKLYDKG